MKNDWIYEQYIRELTKNLEDYQKFISRRKRLVDRGFCCGGGCKECPYDPQFEAGSTAIKPLPRR